VHYLIRLRFMASVFWYLCLIIFKSRATRSSSSSSSSSYSYFTLNPNPRTYHTGVYALSLVTGIPHPSAWAFWLSMCTSLVLLVVLGFEHSHSIWPLNVAGPLSFFHAFVCQWALGSFLATWHEVALLKKHSYRLRKDNAL